MSEMNRHFLGWDKPFLPTAVKWLQENYLGNSLGSSNQFFVLVQGQAIANHLQSILISDASKQGRSIELPIIGTTSQFFRMFISETDRIAQQQSVLIATATVLREMPPNKVTSIVGPRRPRKDDFLSWSSLAQLVWAAIRAASGGGHQLDTTTWPEEAQLILTEHAVERFNVLQTIQLKVQQLLSEDGQHSFESKQLELIQQSSILDFGSLQHVVVIGATDLAGIATAMLDRISRAGVTVDSLIRAPEYEADGFDSYGCINTAYWMDAEIEIVDHDIVVAGSPSSQSAEVVRVLESLQDTATADQITIAATDEHLIPIIQRHVHGHGVHSRFAGGIPFAQTPEAIFISGIAEFISTRSYSSYAAIIRHPEVVRLLNVTESVLEKLSRYSTDVIPSHISEASWFEPQESHFNTKGLQELHAQVIELFAPYLVLEHNPASISECSSAIRDLILRVYGNETLDRTDIKLKALQNIFGVLDALDSLADVMSERLGLLRISEVIRFIIQELEGVSIPELPNAKAIDTVGWLEAMAVDSPHLIVVGMSSDLGGGDTRSDAFFPDSLRYELGMETMDKRMARDAHAVVAMQNARLNHGSIKWIVGRKNEDGDPLAPSPLLMRCVDGERLAQRSGELVMSFEREAPEVPPQYNLLEEGGGIQIPNPSEYPAKKSTTKVSVTAFKDYIACPYRFWLKHVMKLNIAEEGNTELDAKLFGSFIHTVLQRFGENETMKNATDPLVIERSLFDVLDCVAKDQLGPLLSGKVKIQLELAKYRLSEFAKHQAQCAIEGWSILCSEKKVRKELTIDDTSFVISGVIDRIEVHQDGRIRVLDYKTGSSTANKAHFNKDQWIDLQLPLYRILLTEIPELNDFDTSKENVSLGYFKVGDQESEIGIDILTPPEKIAETLQDTIDGTIQSIMECDYKETPTAPAPKYSDTYSWICQDNSVIEESSDDYYG